MSCRVLTTLSFRLPAEHFNAFKAFFTFFNIFSNFQTLNRQEGVRYVGGVVDAEADGDDDDDAGDGVDGEAPEVHEAQGVDYGHDHAHHDQEAAHDVREQEQGHDEDAGHGDAEVTEELGLDDLVRLPVGVLLGRGEDAVAEVQLGDGVLHPVHRGDVLAGPVEPLVREAECGHL